MKDTPDNSKTGRRSFLKGTAAAAGAAIAATTKLAQAAEPAADKPAAAKAAADKKLPSETFITQPGSDFMADVLRTIGIQYLAINPASGFRSLHESIINHLGNKNPEILTCMHEESAAGIAHGYAKAAGKPIGIMMHGTVGLQHATMGIYNAWCDRVPMLVFASNGTRADKRRPGVEWLHSVQDPAGLVRDFVKWDDQPASLQHFAESTVRAYKYHHDGSDGTGDDLLRHRAAGRRDGACGNAAHAEDEPARPAAGRYRGVARGGQAARRGGEAAHHRRPRG